MKKALSAILACCLMVACTVSCDKKNKGEDTGNTVTYGEAQKGLSGEEALKDFFVTNYTRDAGEAAFNYMYTQQMIDDMIAKDEYRQLVVDYNNGKNQMLDLSKNVPSITSIESSTPLTDEQLGWAEQYLIDFTATRGVVVNALHVTEGYDFKFNILDYNGNAKPNTACLVKVENDGWKFVGTLNGLVERYGTASAENATS